MDSSLHYLINEYLFPTLYLCWSRPLSLLNSQLQLFSKHSECVKYERKNVGGNTEASGLTTSLSSQIDSAPAGTTLNNMLDKWMIDWLNWQWPCVPVKRHRTYDSIQFGSVEVQFWMIHTDAVTSELVVGGRSFGRWPSSRTVHRVRVNIRFPQKKHLKRSSPPFMLSLQTDQARYIKPYWCRCASFTLHREGYVYASPTSDSLSAGFTKNYRTDSHENFSKKLGWRMSIGQNWPH